jgi:hypothetical protein
MTVVAALTCPNGDVVIGADSRTDAAGHILPITSQKWYRSNLGWLGLSGTSYQTTALGRMWSGLDTATLSVDDAVERLRVFAEERKFFRQAGDDYRLDAEGIVVAHGHVFDLDSGLCCRPVWQGIWARGSGCDYAIGAASAWLSVNDHVMLSDQFERDRITPTFVMERALEAACHWNSRCGGELFIRRVEK